MRFVRSVYFAARPYSEGQSWLSHAEYIIRLEEDIANRQVPILIDVVIKVVHEVWACLAGMDFGDSRLAGEEGQVSAACQFVAHLDGKADRACVSDAFRLRNRIAAAALIGLP